MTIAIISMIRDSWGGSEELWADMSEAALGKKYKVLHLAYETDSIHPRMQDLINKGLQAYTRPSYKEKLIGPLGMFAEKILFFFKKRANLSLIKLFKKRPDIILYNATCYSIAREKRLLRLLKNFTGKFFILGHFNDERPGELNSYLRQKTIQAFQKSNNVFFVSYRNLQIAKRQLVIKIDHAVIVRNPVNISSNEIIPYPKKSTIQFAMVGNLIIAHKGQDIAFETLSTDIWKNRDWHLNIYGSGKDEFILKELATFFKLNERITFHGRVNDIRSVWAKNHILLMPSYMEGMPLAIVEAMLCGRPCVATDVGGTAEWIVEGQSGFIADAATVFSFSKALEKSWNHKENWESMGGNAHERAITLYDPKAGETLLQLMIKNL
jgi:glycosyltransferase involved in cell wall biosynthesis